MVIDAYNSDAKPRRETTTLNKNLLYLSNTTSTSYEARNDATAVLSNAYRRDFECLSIRNHDAEQEPSIPSFYHDDVVRSLLTCEFEWLSMPTVVMRNHDAKPRR